MDKEHHDMETYADMYNTCDAIEKLSKLYAGNCRERMESHARKAYKGALVTIVGALAGFLYTIFQHGAAQYYSGAEDVYHKYDNIVEDCDRFEDEWLEASGYKNKTGK